VKKYMSQQNVSQQNVNRRVVITGMGAVTPVGNDADSTWQAIKAGTNGIAEITAFDTSDFNVKLAAEVKLELKDHIPAAELRKMDRYTSLAVVAAREVLKDSGVNAENTDLHRAGCFISSGIGGLATMAREHAKGLERSFERISAMFIPMTIANMAAGKISIESGFKGYCMAPVTACAGGTNAIGDALRQIRHGYADVIMAGGAEGCIMPLAVGGFSVMGALHQGDNPNRASIPFDLERSGFVIGEGAAMIMLEEYEHAKRRGAKIYAEVIGYGATSDAYHITAPDPDAKGGELSMIEALNDAGLRPVDIGYINAHGTSTPLNDKGESKAIKTVFGEHAYKTPISSTKSMVGHLLGAAGAVEAIVCINALRESFLPPTINYQMADPDCDLDYIPNVGREAEIKYALSNSLGFGGHNATLIFAKI